MNKKKRTKLRLRKQTATRLKVVLMLGSIGLIFLGSGFFIWSVFKQIKEQLKVQQRPAELSHPVRKQKRLPAFTPQPQEPAVCTGINFSRNLTIGSMGRDVRCWQALLNTDPDTFINYPWGVPVESESNYFDKKTAEATKRFQEKYTPLILKSLGFQSGTGFFGPSTRSFSNSLLERLRSSLSPEEQREAFSIENASYLLSYNLESASRFLAATDSQSSQKEPPKILSANFSFGTRDTVPVGTRIKVYMTVKSDLPLDKKSVKAEVREGGSSGKVIKVAEGKVTKVTSENSNYYVISFEWKTSFWMESRYVVILQACNSAGCSSDSSLSFTLKGRKVMVDLNAVKLPRGDVKAEVTVHNGDLARYCTVTWIGDRLTHLGSRQNYFLPKKISQPQVFTFTHTYTKGRVGEKYPPPLNKWYAVRADCRGSDSSLIFSDSEFKKLDFSPEELPPNEKILTWVFVFDENAGLKKFKESKRKRTIQFLNNAFPIREKGIKFRSYQFLSRSDCKAPYADVLDLSNDNDVIKCLHWTLSDQKIKGDVAAVVIVTRLALGGFSYGYGPVYVDKNPEGWMHAHEVGHSYGFGHINACGPTRDECFGYNESDCNFPSSEKNKFIMSYCAGYKFGPAAYAHLKKEFIYFLEDGATNNQPEIPTTPSGPSLLNKREQATYKAKAADPDGDQVKLVFHWGDGITTTTGFKSSGSTFLASHSWNNAGAYLVKVRAIDVEGLASSWSSSLAVTVKDSSSPGNNPPSVPSAPQCFAVTPPSGNNPPNNPQTPQCSASSDNNPPNTSGAPTCNAP